MPQGDNKINAIKENLTLYVHTSMEDFEKAEK